MEHTILDPYGTPYGGVEKNFDLPIRHGGSGYEHDEVLEPVTYGDQLTDIAWFGRQNVSGVA
jgi:hypothetical protein